MEPLEKYGHILAVSILICPVKFPSNYLPFRVLSE
jgi:hypothetical protein